MYYRTCPHCGSNLDPSKTCDCEIERRNEQEEQERGRRYGAIQSNGAGRDPRSVERTRGEGEGTVNHMLYAGAKVMREEMKAALKEYKIKDTGDLIKSIKSGKIKKAGGAKYVTVSPTGYDRHGVPNAIKAYVYELGNSKHPARPWKTLADERGGSKAIQRMREVFEEEMSKAGGGAGEWEE